MRREIAAAILVAALSFFAFSIYLLALPEIADGDSYYHLGIAKQYATNGIIHDLPWARFSIMARGFGDKEFLFHLLTAPFTVFGETEEMGRLAVAFFNAMIVGVLAWLGIRALGWWGLLVPFVVYLGSSSFWGRAMRLRPEILALLILLLAIWLAARRRYVLLLIASFVFAQSYTAAHVVVGLCVIFAAVDYVRERKIDLMLVASPAIGVVAGLVFHPHFPHNLVVWWYQNVLFFVNKARLDVGAEILPPTASAMIVTNLAAAIVIAAMWISSYSTTDRDDLRRPAQYFTVAAIVFALLYVFMSRMSTYAVPLAVLAAMFRLGRRDREPRKLPMSIAAIVAIAVITLDPNSAFRQRFGGEHFGEMKYDALGKAILPGAKVAADWRNGEALVLFAPQGRYLNVLDPIFMAIPYPREYALQSALWAGKTPDVPVAVRALQSDFIVYQQNVETVLDARVRNDPRIHPIYTRGMFLGLVVPPSRDVFLLDWTVTNQKYPVAPDPRIREVEAFIDTTRISSAAACATATHPLVQPRDERLTFEFAPFGPSSLSIDGRLIAANSGEMGAILGQGIVIPFDARAGAHEIAVTTCRTAPDRPRGFYLLIRSRTAGFRL